MSQLIQSRSKASLASRKENGLKELSGKYLTFRLGKEEFGIEILKVREIIGTMPMTAVPGVSEHIIPVMDLRHRLGISGSEESKRSCIIVVEVVLEHRSADLGLLVDSVSEVLNISGNDIEPPPELGMSIDTNYVLGLAKSGQGVKILVDINRMLTHWHELNLSGMAS